MNRKMSAINILCSVIVILASSIHAKQPEFKTNAVDSIKIEHKNQYRRSETHHDYTKLEIEASIMEMLEDNTVIDKNNVVVEFKSEVMDDYQKLDATPSMRGGVYRWTISDIIPCHDHNVRLSVFDVETGLKTTFSYPHTIVAPSAEDIIKENGYKPKQPESIEFGNSDGGSMEVLWTPSYCAQGYEVVYQPIICEETCEAKTIKTVNNRIMLDGLDSCQEYEVTVVPQLGDQDGDEIIDTFMTFPSEDEAEKLEPIIVPGTDGVSVKWRGSEKLSCIPTYNVQVCDLNRDCHNNKELERDDSLAFMEFSSEDSLDMCTPYTLDIRPVHSKVYLRPKTLNFKTLSQSLESIPSSLGPVTASIGSDQIISLSWSPISCADVYNVYRRQVDSDIWELVGSTESNTFQQQGESCSEFIYGVAASMDGIESEKVETDEPVFTDVNNDELPIMIVEEKANGSITFILKTGEVNTMCEVDRLHIRHAGGEDYYEMAEVENNKITINNFEGDKVEGRLHFKATDSWSLWGSSDSPIMEKQTLQEMNFLLPIIIGSVVALALIIIVIALVVRSKKDKAQYDEEKAHGATDESKKLNDSSEEKIINGKK